MRKRAALIGAVLLVGLLSGCSTDANPATHLATDLQDVIDLIPWAKSVANDASAEAITATIEQAQAGLPRVEISESIRTTLDTKLTDLASAVRTNPDAVASYAAQLNAILDEIKAAIRQ